MRTAFVRDLRVGSGHRGHCEPERVMDTGEYFGFVLEIVERDQPVVAQGVSEEWRGRLVGG